MTTFEYILMYLGAYLAGFCIGAAILTLAISKPVKKDKNKNKENHRLGFSYLLFTVFINKINNNIGSVIQFT